MNASAEPSKARRLYLALSERIALGELVPGERLPGEPALAAAHHVSRITVRRALDRLAEEGWVRRHVGAGTFVSGKRVDPVLHADLTDMFAHLREMGAKTEIRLLSFAYIHPAPVIAAALGLKAGERSQRSVRIRSLNGAPFSYLTTHVPEHIGRTYSEADLASIALLHLLEREHIVADRASQSLSATVAGPDVAEALGVPAGAPLLSLTRIIAASDGSGIEHLHALYRPDRFAFHLDLQRTGTVGQASWRPAAQAAA